MCVCVCLIFFNLARGNNKIAISINLKMSVDLEQLLNYYSFVTTTATRFTWVESKEAVKVLDE